MVQKKHREAKSAKIFFHINRCTSFILLEFIQIGPSHLQTFISTSRLKFNMPKNVDFMWKNGLQNILEVSFIEHKVLSFSKFFIHLQAAKTFYFRYVKEEEEEKSCLVVSAQF